MPDAVPDVPPGYEPVPFTEGFLGHVGPLYEDQSRRPAVVGFRVEDRHLNPAGLVHGGLLTTVLDMTMAYNIGLLDEAGGFFVSLGLDCHFLSPGRLGDWLEVHAEIPRIGRQNAYGLARVIRDGDVLMTGSGIFARWRTGPGEG